MYIIYKFIMLDCHCIKSKQINASWKCRHKGKKKEGEKEDGVYFISAVQK